MSVLEPGYTGVLISLGGVKDVSGRGRLADYEYVTMTGPISRQLLAPNPKRIAACIQNIGHLYGGVDALIQIDDRYPGSGPRFQLQTRETLWINQDFPWTGAVFAYVAVGGLYLYVNEIRIA